MPLNPVPSAGPGHKAGLLRLSLIGRRIAWDGFAVGVVILALGVIYRQLVIGRVLAGGDLHLYFYPYWMAATRAFHAQGSLLWNPDLFAGVPLLANSQVGVLYPLNWPFWLFATPALDNVARALHGSVLLHLVLAAINAYVLTRMWIHIWMPVTGQSLTDESRAITAARMGAAIAALIYAGGGFLAVHVEHLNQLQALAWLPLCFLPPRPVSSLADDVSQPGRTRVMAIVAFAMILLAGHTQMAFIAALGVVIWHGAEMLESLWVRAAGSVESRAHPAVGTRSPRSWLRRGVAPVKASLGRLAPFALAGLLAGAQLVPSLQLAQLSGRSTDYAWREAVSFSVSPWELPRALLPSYLTAPLLPEGVAYTGLLGLVLIGLGVGVILRRRVAMGPAALVVAAVFLATGGYNPLYLLLVRLRVPGFAHFRAPARFLGLFVLGAAVLAGLGLTGLIHARKWRTGVVVAGVVFLALALELWAGGQTLPFAAATTIRAYTDLRPATAHLVAAAHAGEAAGLAGHRFLSISETLFEVGDREELMSIYGEQLPDDAVWAYMVASKQREVLVPNLSMAFGVPAVDGYDGGLLPLRSYTTFSRLLLPEGTPDGRLRENLQTIPESRWLNLLGVRHLLTDKTGDVWIGDVLYDRQFQPVLVQGDVLRLASLPEGYAATGLRLLYTGAGEVEIELLDGRVLRSALPQSVEPDVAWPIDWEGATEVLALELRATGGALTPSGASLVDGRLGSFYPLVLSDVFHLVHSGDVKIYEMLYTPLRAFMVHQAEMALSVTEALDMMAAEDFDPMERVVLMGELGEPIGGAAPTPDYVPPSVQDHRVHVMSYGPTRVIIDVDATREGYLVLSDAWYPGWTARLIPQPDLAGTSAISVGPGDASDLTIPVLQANLLFRALPVTPGRWRVTLSYTPWVIYAGLGLSLMGIIALLAYVFAVPQHRLTLTRSRGAPKGQP